MVKVPSRVDPTAPVKTTLRPAAVISRSNPPLTVLAKVMSPPVKPELRAAAAINVTGVLNVMVKLEVERFPPKLAVPDPLSLKVPPIVVAVGSNVKSPAWVMATAPPVVKVTPLKLNAVPVKLTAPVVAISPLKVDVPLPAA